MLQQRLRRRSATAGLMSYEDPLRSEHAFSINARRWAKSAFIKMKVAALVNKGLALVSARVSSSKACTKFSM